MNENTEFEKALLDAFYSVAAKAVTTSGPTTSGPTTFQDDVDQWKQPLLDIARKELKDWRYLLRRYKDGYEQGKLDMKKQMTEEISDIDIYHKGYEHGSADMVVNSISTIIVNDWTYGKDPDHAIIPAIHQRVNGLKIGDRVKILIIKD